MEKNKGEIKVINRNVNTKEDLMKQININSKNEQINALIIIKNYLTPEEIERIFNDEYFAFCPSHLTKLNLTANCLTQIPMSFKSLVNIRTLILNNNKITQIANLDTMTQLERLELRSNQIVKIENLNSNKKLIKLTLSSNHIKHIDKETFPQLDLIEDFGIFGNFLGNESNLSDNELTLTNLCSLISISMPKITSLYIGGNYFNTICNLNIKIKNIINTLKFIDGKPI